MSPIVITLAAIEWNQCPDCGAMFPDGVKLNDNHEPVPGTRVGHAKCYDRPNHGGKGR